MYLDWAIRFGVFGLVVSVIGIWQIHKDPWKRHMRIQRFIELILVVCILGVVAAIVFMVQQSRQ